MPGLFGFTNRCRRSQVLCNEILSSIGKILNHKPYHRIEYLQTNTMISGGRVSNGIINESTQPIVNNSLTVWMNGEFYNQEHLLGRKITNSNDIKILTELYRDDPALAFLGQIDGMFNAVIYDADLKKIILINDRHGLFPLYWMKADGELIWSAELKGILPWPGFSPEIDQLAVDEFLFIGYQLEDQTWFKNVNLMSAGTYLSFDLDSGALQEEPYWDIGNIVPNTTLSAVDLSEGLYQNFSESIKSRTNDNLRIGISLSGGLDSRAITAEILNQDRSASCFTFGKENCDEVRIAQKVATRSGFPWEFIKLEQSNWFTERLIGVWLTDGQLSLLHNHAPILPEHMRQQVDINLHAFAGDLIIGGSYLKSVFLDPSADSYNISIYKQLGLNKNILTLDFGDHLNNIIKKYSRSDFFFLRNRVKRFTSSGPTLTSMSILDRKPTFSNQIFEFCYSIPDELRVDGRLYHKMLMKYYPDFFKLIPWQFTGLPLGVSKNISRVYSKGRSLMNHLGYMLNRTNVIRIENNHQIANYRDWFKSGQEKNIFNQLLTNTKAIYPDIISRKRVITDWNSFLDGKDNLEQIGRYLTLEIWLQQVYNNRYRDE